MAVAVISCNGLEPCASCEVNKLQCTYLTLSDSKKKIHDAYVQMKKQEQAQKLKGADIIVARMGGLDIGGTNTNFGPILSQVINLPRYEQPPSDFKNDTEVISNIDIVEKTLIDCYFKFFNYYMPILSRKRFMDQLADPEQLKTREVQKVLACVLATGFAFRHEIHEPATINRMEPNYGTGMCRKFQHFNAQDVFNSSLENIQCYLILTGFYSSIAGYDVVHNLVALAHSGSAALGLNRNKGLYYQIPRSEKDSADMLEMGRRIYWSVVIVCSGYSLSHQSPYITSNDYDVAFPARRQFDTCQDYKGHTYDDFEGIKDLHYFVPMYEICSNIADITCTATKQRPCSKVDEAREQLHAWRQTVLPKDLQIDIEDDSTVERQTRFSKFYHAIAFMFEICLHHTFQLDEAHRTKGVHGIWSNYCYEAAIGIIKIYRTWPMTRMNAHVILTVAGGTFANIVASRLLGKEEKAQGYCNEINLMMTDIVRASSSKERQEIVNFVQSQYGGGRQAGSKLGDFMIAVPETPPWNERSTTEATSSPEHIGDGMESDEDDYDEMEASPAKESENGFDSDPGESLEDKRMTDYYASSGQPQQGYPGASSSSVRPHPSMAVRTNSSTGVGISQAMTGTTTTLSSSIDTRYISEPSQQQQQLHQFQSIPSQQTSSYPHQLQSQQTFQVHSQQASVSKGHAQHQQAPMVESNYVGAVYEEMVPISSGQLPISAVGLSAGYHANFAHQQHPLTSPFIADGSGVGVSGVDSGFVGGHGYSDQDGYLMRSAHATDARHQHPHHAQHHHVSQGVHHNHQVSVDGYHSVTGATSLDNMQAYDPQQHQQTQFLQLQLNEAQQRIFEEYNAILSTEQYTPEQRQQIELKMEQEIIEQSGFDSLTPVSLKNSQLLTGTLTGGAMLHNNGGNHPGNNHLDGLGVATQLMYSTASVTTAGSSGSTIVTTPGSTSFSTSSEPLTSPVSATSSSGPSLLGGSGPNGGDLSDYHQHLARQQQQSQEQFQHQHAALQGGAGSTGGASLFGATHGLMGMSPAELDLVTAAGGGVDMSDFGSALQDNEGVLVLMNDPMFAARSEMFSQGANNSFLPSSSSTASTSATTASNMAATSQATATHYHPHHPLQQQQQQQQQQPPYQSQHHTQQRPLSFVQAR
ncbi:hypothetical protein BGW38_004175 [Lunasporangiospora selenospora]|uniref:Xylanolytic transcriptional activator regulatory domain-containing protein n=1 Tax=Lunasporangiospora selenospora TaxID=979761 RepID=A0A9P6FRQ6_9FUNG|nr:hypothetical protein BGW38_004175 [Lunasporangiospora selenospora]